MTTRVRIHKDGAITVHQRPNRLMRWLGALARDFHVEYGGGWYVNADTGQPVTWQENRAIEKAVRR